MGLQVIMIIRRTASPFLGAPNKVLTLQVHGGGKHGRTMNVLVMVCAPIHHVALRGRSIGMHGGHAAGGARTHGRADRIVRAGHGGGRGRIPVSGLRHLAARGEVTVGARHIGQVAGRIHAILEAGRVELGRRLIQIRVIHRVLGVAALNCISNAPN